VDGTTQKMRVPTPSPPLITQGVITLSESEKAKSLAESPKAQCQLIIVTLVLEFIEIFDVVLRSYFLTPASESKLTNPDEVHEAMWGLKVSRLWVQTVFRTGS